MSGKRLFIYLWRLHQRSPQRMIASAVAIIVAIGIWFIVPDFSLVLITYSPAAIVLILFSLFIWRDFIKPTTSTENKEN